MGPRNSSSILARSSSTCDVSLLASMEAASRRRLISERDIRHCERASFSLTIARSCPLEERKMLSKVFVTEDMFDPLNASWNLWTAKDEVGLERINWMALTAR